MRRVCLALLLAAAVPAGARAQVSEGGAAGREAAPSPVALARAYVMAHAGALSVARPEGLRLERVIDAHGASVVRFVPTVRGRPILDASVVVRLRRAVVEHASARGAAVSPVDVGPLLSEAGSIAIARQEVGRDARVIAIEEAYEARGENAYPVHVVDLAGAALSQRHRVVVDRASGAVRALYPHASDALGRVFPSNPVTDEGLTTDVELVELASVDRLSGERFHVASCNAGPAGCAPAQLARADAAGDFLFEPDERAYDDPFAEVSAYHHASRAAAYFQETHGFRWSCGAEEVMRVLVNYTITANAPHDNASYTPTLGRECGFMLFGQGTLDFAYDADVVVHELAHSVIADTSGLSPFVLDQLGVSYEPGALNEGLADYFAATLSGDPALAEYFAEQPGAGEGALRRLDERLACPNDLVGESHYDGRLFAGLLWDLRGELGAAGADTLAFTILASLDGGSQLADAAEVLVGAARDLEADARLEDGVAARVEALAMERGLLGCTRVVPLDDGLRHLAYTGLSTITATTGASIAPIHFVVTIPADATSLRLLVTRATPRGTYLLHARVGAPVRVTGSRLVETATLPLDDLRSVTLDAESALPLPRCERLYLAVETEDLQEIGGALFELSATFERAGSAPACAPPDAGLAADAGADGGATLRAGGGCRCGATPAPGGARGSGWLVLVVLARRVARRSVKRAHR